MFLLTANILLILRFTRNTKRITPPPPNTNQRQAFTKGRKEHKGSTRPRNRPPPQTSRPPRNHRFPRQNRTKRKRRKQREGRSGHPSRMQGITLSQLRQSRRIHSPAWRRHSHTSSAMRRFFKIIAILIIIIGAVLAVNLIIRVIAFHQLCPMLDHDFAWNYSRVLSQTSAADLAAVSIASPTSPPSFPRPTSASSYIAFMTPGASPSGSPHSASSTAAASPWSSQSSPRRRLPTSIPNCPRATIPSP